MDLKKPTVCAVVVTFNRIHLLRECILAIKQQCFECDVFVVNNNSNDATESFLVENKINHINLKENIGGAGGFNMGIKKTLNYDYLWLMDDDCIPKTDALDKLMQAVSLLKNEFGFLSSNALWLDGNENKMNKANLKSFNKVFENIYKVYQATFVSFFIKTDTIKKCGLPIKDFFIWGDDIEYSRRIAIIYKIESYHIKNSIVVHKTKNNTGSKIAFDSIDNINRYFYAYRNELYLYRKEGINSLLYYFLKCLYNFLRILIFSKDQKFFRCKILFCGIRAGLKFYPEIEYI